MLWQADFEAGKIYALNRDTAKVEHIIEVDSHVAAVACLEEKLYYTEPISNTLGVIDLNTAKPLSFYELPGESNGLTVAADGFWYVDAQLNQICELRLR